MSTERKSLIAGTFALSSGVAIVCDKDNAMKILRWLNQAEVVGEVPAQSPCHMLSPQANETMCLHSNRPGAGATARGATQEGALPMSRKRTPRKHRIIRTHGQRIAWTNSSLIPDDEVIAALTFVAGHVNLDRVIVHVKGHGDRYFGRWGMAYDHIPGIASTAGLDVYEWRYLITVTDKGGAFFETLAHEAKHIEQFRERLPRSEKRCNTFAAWLHKQWEAARA